MYQSIIIGTGFSGLAMAIELKARGIHNFIILEKADEIGGTWRENTYPGAECDIPSALYSYSFEPYPDWEYKWSHQPQILRYLKHCAERYELHPHIRFKGTFTGAAWQEEACYWTVKTEDGREFRTRTLVTAIGQLHHPSLPDIPGRESFQGPNFHSARWDHAVNLTGKTVGVIGNAASAVQFIPEIAKSAEKVLIFQRSANWMLPKQDRLYREWEKRLVRRFPFLLRLYRLKTWLLTGLLFLMMKTGNRRLRKIYEGKAKSYIRQTIRDPELRKKLIPDYPLGAKRLLFSDNYYPTLNLEQVVIITERINSIFKGGIIGQGGKKYLVDLLIYATGFKTHLFLMGLKIEGKNRLSIRKFWQKESKAYLGITVAGFPNFFMMQGPNTNLGHSSVLLMSEAQASYIAQCVQAIEENGWRSLEVRAEVMEQYQQSIRKRLKKMVWMQVEHSWYRTESGELPNNWPGRTMEYQRRTKRVVFSDFHKR